MEEFSGPPTTSSDVSRGSTPGPENADVYEEMLRHVVLTPGSARSGPQAKASSPSHRDRGPSRDIDIGDGMHIKTKEIRSSSHPKATCFEHDESLMAYAVGRPGEDGLVLDELHIRQPPKPSERGRREGGRGYYAQGSTRAADKSARHNMSGHAPVAHPEAASARAARDVERWATSARREYLEEARLPPSRGTPRGEGLTREDPVDKHGRDALFAFCGLQFC